MMIEDATPLLVFGAFFAAFGVALVILGELEHRGGTHGRQNGNDNG